MSSPDDNYRLVVSGDVWGQANDLQQEADRAVCDGYTGIRVWADVTSLAGDQALLQHLLDYETATEAMFRRWPVTGLCALDVTLVPEEWSRFASRHLFRRRWGDTADLAVTLFDNVVCLVGEVDVSSVAELQDSLASVERTTAGDLVVDLTGLEFLDVAGTRALASFAGRLGSRDRCVRLVGARGVAARVLGLFGLDGCAEV